MSGFSQSPSSLPRSNRNRTVTAVLGPTNTGKTHLAIERMLGHESGMIGLPLRLLAREVYAKVAKRAGEDAVALVTGEEKIIPPEPRFWVCTVEAMPLDTDAAFVAIDEVQLAADLERGHVFTDRILNVRGTQETLLLGAATMRSLLERIVPGLNVVTRPRMSVLTYSGQKKITRLPARSAIVAFSSEEVYSIAELVRRQRGGAAVVMGGLSPRTRNAQVELYQSGDVDFLIATDAIGMGLNLDVDHVAFAASRKFDGYQYRNLTAGELGQISGRAGRHMKDGTFGVTGRTDPFADDMVEALESHAFEPVKILQWRARDLDMSSINKLRESLDVLPPTFGLDPPGLTRAPPTTDLNALDYAMKDDEILGAAHGRDNVALLWDVCQVPDYRKIAPANHYELVYSIFTQITKNGFVDPEWFEANVKRCSNTEGDIDTLANRISHIRTWTFVANRRDWLKDPDHWRGVTRDIEDGLSDALHVRLTQRFVDRRTSVLMKRLRENTIMEAEITDSGDVVVEGEHVGHLDGFRFAPASKGDSAEAKAVRAAAQRALGAEILRRAERVGNAENSAFILASGETIRWQGEAIAKLTSSEDILKPRVILLADEQLSGAMLEKVQNRLDTWIETHVATYLKPLLDIRDSAELTGISRGVAFRLVESLGNIQRTDISEDIRKLEQDVRAVMRRLGVRFGAHTIFLPALLKPAPSQLLAGLWALTQSDKDIPGLQEIPQLSASGRTSVPVDASYSPELYRIAGYRVCGARAVRVDILERLADLIRPLIAWRPSADVTLPPPGAIERGGGFTITVAMTSLLGCSGDDFAGILRSLGYRAQKVPKPEVPVVAETPAVSENPNVAGGVDAAEAAKDAEGSTVTSESSVPDQPNADGGGVEVSSADESASAGVAPEGDAPSLEEIPTEASANHQEGGTKPVEDEKQGESETTSDPCVAAEPDQSLEQQAVSPLTKTDGTEEPISGDESVTTLDSLPEPEPVVDGVDAVLSDGGQDAASSPEPIASPDVPPEAAANKADDPQKPEEPELIEVWRPGGGERRRHSQSRAGNAKPGGQKRQAGQNKQDGQNRQTGPNASVDGNKKAENLGQYGRKSGDDANKNERQGKRPKGGDRSGRDRNRNEGRSGPASKGPKRPPNKDNSSRKPARSEKPIDPDSPFAALAALKASLEKDRK